MSLRGRAFFIAAAPAMAALASTAERAMPVGAYPGAGPYGDLAIAIAASKPKLTNVATFVNFDLRVLDTLGEALILFASVLAVTLLLREKRGEHRVPSPLQRPGRPPIARSDTLEAIGLWVAILGLIFGLALIVHAQLGPGGGFQGGALLATSWLMLTMVRRNGTFDRMSPESVLHALCAIGAGGFLVVGLLGQLLLSNLLVGLEVGTGLVVIFAAFLREGA